MLLKGFFIALTLSLLVKANGKKRNEKPSEGEQNVRAPRSLHSRSNDGKSFGYLGMELAKLHLIEETLKQRKFLNKFGDKLHEDSNDKCTKIRKVGDPIVHHHSGNTQGAWMRDPLGVLGAQKIWYMNGYHGKKLLEFDSMIYFKAGIPSKTYNLPYNFDGTGAVVYGRYLYYNRASSYYIVKYDLVKEVVVTQRYPYTSYIKPRTYYYPWSSTNTFDLSIDESGLWVLYSYSSYKGKLCASLLDPLTLSTLQTYCGISSESMTSMGNAFVACGIVYMIDNYNSKTTTINYYYDTATGQSGNPNIKFQNKFGYNSMVTYNPHEKVLYAWDRHRQITYPLQFEK